MVLRFFFQKLENSKIIGWIALFFFLFIIVVYASFLDRTPVHLNQDELGFSLNAYSIAKTGFDENGRFFPLYFWHLNVMWSTPIIVYLTALFLSAFPLSETVIRLPSVFIGIVNSILIYFLATLLFKNKWYGLLAAGLLALTPVHFIHSRILLDTHFIIPFVIGWLLILFLFLENKKPWLLLVSGLILGIGIYSYHAALFMMPLYLLFTALVISPEIKKQKKLLPLLLIGFTLPLLPLIPWLEQHPNSFFSDQVRYTRLYDANLGPLSGIITLFTPESLMHRIEVFLAYFNPSFLFLRGDASLIHSTWKTGVFLLPFLVFILLGIYQAVKHGFSRLTTSRFTILLVVGFFTAPLAAALVGDHYRISRALVILPFATLLAVCGVQFLLSRRKHLLFIAYCLLLIVPLQFTYFLYDYLTDYRARSYNWFRYNIPGALESAIAQDQLNPVDAIYLDNRINFIDRYWRFFVIKNKREDLLNKTFYFDPYLVDLENLPPNSLLLYHFDHVDGQKNKLGPFRKVSTTLEPDGTSRFYIFKN